MLEAGDQAPGFSLTSLDGATFRFKGGEGYLSLLVFFETDCPTCRLTIPYLNRLYREVGDTANIIGISQDSEGPTRELVTLETEVVTS